MKICSGSIRLHLKDYFILQTVYWLYGFSAEASFIIKRALNVI